MVLPAPFGPTMAVSSPGRKRAADVVDRDMAAEADGQIAGFEGEGHAVSSRRCSGSHGTSPLPREHGRGERRRIDGSPLVADRDVHVLDLEFAHRLLHRPGEFGSTLTLK